MIGWWDVSPPITVSVKAAASDADALVSDDDVRATAYVRRGNATLCALGSWAVVNTSVTLAIDWAALGLSRATATIRAPAMDGVQPGRSFAVGSPIEVEAAGGKFLSRLGRTALVGLCARVWDRWHKCA